MELRQLEHFVTVAEEQHFTRAAARVHVVQSSLSASIKALERELGEPLFVRDNRRVTLTQAGRALLPAARATLAAVDEGRDTVAGVHGVLRGELHVGAIQTLGVVDLAALLTTFRKDHPGVTLRLSWGAAGDLARAVVDGELDVAFVDGPIDRVRLMTTDLGHDALVLAMRRDTRSHVVAPSASATPCSTIEISLSTALIRPCVRRSTQRAPAPDSLEESPVKSQTCSTSSKW